MKSIFMIVILNAPMQVVRIILKQINESEKKLRLSIAMITYCVVKM